MSKTVGFYLSLFAIRIRSPLCSCSFTTVEPVVVLNIAAVGYYCNVFTECASERIFLKSVNIWRIYRQKFGGMFFIHGVQIYLKVYRIRKR